jgi:hypothetical protein
VIRRLLLLLLLLLPVQASAQQPTFASTFLEGSWALRHDGTIVMRWDLQLTADGWAGAWTKPTSFASDGTRFGNIRMPAVERTADRGRAIGEWAEITFDDPRPNEEPDQFRIRLTSPDRAELLYVGTGLPPFTLERVAAGAPLGPFEEGRVYGEPSVAGSAAARPAPAPAIRPPPAPPPPVRQPPPPEDEPEPGPPAMVGR